MKRKYDFPQDFIWGAATAAFQVEGAYDEDGKSESIWDRFCKIPGKIENYANGNVACDHYHKLDEDIEIMKELGLQTYRFSINWCRVIPQGIGEINQKGLDFYERLVDKLIEAGIKPCVTLYHWDLPQVLQDNGGFANREIVRSFKDYAKAVFERLGNKVERFITFNEPWVICMLGYGVGMHAPGIMDFSTSLTAAHNLLLAHGETVKLYREMEFNGEIGIALNMTYSYPSDVNNEKDIKAAEINNGYINKWFAEPIYKGSYPKDVIEEFKVANVVIPEFSEQDMKCIKQPIDFLGINFYTGVYIKYSELAYPIRGEGVDKGYPRTQMDWEIMPHAFTDLLTWVQKAYSPKAIFITENGAAFNDMIDLENEVKDTRRVDYLKRHFIAMHEAIKQGANIKGYYLWSLMDNFEWSYGYRPRFGLVYVDYMTLERTIKQSGYWYKQIIQNNSLEV